MQLLTMPENLYLDTLDYVCVKNSCLFHSDLIVLLQQLCIDTRSLITWGLFLAHHRFHNLFLCPVKLKSAQCILCRSVTPIAMLFFLIWRHMLLTRMAIRGVRLIFHIDCKTDDSHCLFFKLCYVMFYILVIEPAKARLLISS